MNSENEKPKNEEPQEEPVVVEQTNTTDSPPPPQPEKPETPELLFAEFPSGFWRKVDYLLRNPDMLRQSLRHQEDLSDLSKALFQISLVMSVLYGAVMGATNLLQGTSMELHYKLLMILITAIKVPALYLLTLAIILPPVYVLNAFVGARLSFSRMCALLLSSIAITVTVLASMATVAFFFALTSRSYNFIKLLHVAFFVYAGLAGLGFLVNSVKAISLRDAKPTPNWLFAVWLLLYMFVGTQLAWVLRPFVGWPDDDFALFRPRSGNFYENVYESLKHTSK